MLTKAWLAYAQKQLVTAEISTARLDCLVLLEDETGKDRGWLLAHPEYKLQGSVLKKLNTKITRRSQHIPLAYIRGKAEFYGREFFVNEHTLVPRPETETMIDLLKTLLRKGPSFAHSALQAGGYVYVAQNGIEGSGGIGPGSCILDVGTGSGCIAITAALELPELFVHACDIDTQCLKIAEQNAAKMGADIHVYESDLLNHADACDVLLCNLPYVPNDYAINTAASHEPKLALFGGTDGLDLYRKMFTQITAHNRQPGYILTESLPSQHQALAAVAAEAGYQLTRTDDFIQLFEPIS